MATKIRLETLLRHGEMDRGDCSFIVSRKTYEELPILEGKTFEEYHFEPDEFNEIFRGHRNESGSRHKAIRLWKEGEISPDIDDPDYYVNPNVYWYVVWIEKEGIWIVFEYRDYDSLDESYGSTVETASPWHGPIYRPSDEIERIIKIVYG